MRIAVYDNLPEGGAKRVVFEQIKQLSAAHEILYFTNIHDSIFPFEEYILSKSRYNLDVPSLKGWRRPLQELGLLSILWKNFRIAKDIENSKADVVLVHHCKITQTPSLLLFLNIPSVYYIEEPFRIAFEPSLFPIITSNPLKKMYEMSRRKIVSLIDKVSIKKATLCITNSHFTQENVTKYYKKNSTVIRPGVNTTIFHTSTNKSSPKHFLFIGEKENINGYDLLLDALQLLKKNIPIEFVTFKKNTFRVTDGELCKLYQETFATLCLSKNEPFGLTAIESMACGTPVIAVQEGGYAETVTNDTGIFISRSSEELSKALSYLFSDQQLRKRLSLNCCEHIKNNFNWQKHTTALEKCLKKAIQL